MRKLKNFISKAMAFIYVYLVSACKKKKVVSNGKILIIATGHMGNALMDIESMIEMRNLFIKEKKEVYLLCPPSMWKAFNLIEDMSGFQYLGEQCHYGGYHTDFKNVHSIVKELEDYEFEKVIVTLTNDPEAHYLVARLLFNQSYGVFDDVQHTAGGLRYYFERFYTDKVMAPIDMHEFQRMKLLVHKLGGTDYRVRIHYTKSLEDNTYSESRPYITVALDSMSPARRWPIEKYMEFAKYIVNSTDYMVYLTGSSINPEDEEKLEGLLKNKKIYNFIGNTSLAEWIEMLRGSSFHLSVDSGSVHFAASVGTPCICLSGVWDGTRCMPYRLDVLDDRTANPVCVYQKNHDIATKKCYGCKIKTGRFGLGNVFCQKAVDEEKPCLCLSNIDVGQVIDEFNKMI